MKDFMNNAKGLAKNPLGIIALFISLIYGFASLVLGVSVNNLQGNERLILIWFLVLFPVIVLAAFVYLVVYHHQKLYAPADFRDDKSFLETFDKENKVVTEFEEQKQIDKTESKITNVTKKNSQISQVLSFDDFREKYTKIENLAIEKIKQEYNGEVKRNVRIKGLQRAEFDGVIIERNEIVFIEVKYIPSNKITKRIIDNLNSIKKQLEDFSRKRYIDRKITFYIFIVFEDESSEILQEEKNKIIELINSDLINIKIDLIDYKTLEKE